MVFMQHMSSEIVRVKVMFSFDTEEHARLSS